MYTSALYLTIAGQANEYLKKIETDRVYVIYTNLTMIRFKGTFQVDSQQE
jgi:hypothetical protein